MFTVALVLFGLLALRELKVNLLPDLSYPTLTVRTEYVGAAPSEIENLVTEPIEESVGVVKNLRKLHSVSDWPERRDSGVRLGRSEEHTSELQSLMRISYAVFCLKKKKKTK